MRLFQSFPWLGTEKCNNSWTMTLSHLSVHTQQLDFEAVVPVRRELCPLVFQALVPEVLDEVVHILVVEVPGHQREIVRCAAFHLDLEQLFQEAEVFDDGVHLVAVEGQRLFQRVENPDEIEDKAVRLQLILALVLVRAVHARDGL